MADLTRRAEEILRTVPWVAAEDTRHSGPLLKQLGAQARTMPAHQHNEHEAAARIVEKLQAGEAVALISDAGTPGISDPGARIVAAVRAAGCKVVPLPAPARRRRHCPLRPARRAFPVLRLSAEQGRPAPPGAGGTARTPLRTGLLRSAAPRSGNGCRSGHRAWRTHAGHRPRTDQAVRIHPFLPAARGA
jgi:hypothetical protein